MEQIQTYKEFESLIGEKDKFFLLKHSSTCPISAAGYDEFSQFANENPGVSCYYLVVQDARPLSNEIAEKFNVKHESPQAILFTRENAAWHASHWNITAKKLSAALEENQ